MISFLLYTCYLIAIAEGSLWVASLVSKDFKLLLSNRYGKERFLDDPLLVLRGNPEFAEHDQWGFRNKGDVPKKVDFVAFGDSQTWGINSGREMAWPQQTAAYLGLTGYNMAIPLWSPAHYLLVVDQALSLRPSLVISTFYLGNDLWDAAYLIYKHNSLPQLSAQDSVAEDMRHFVSAYYPVINDISLRKARLLGPGFSQKTDTISTKSEKPSFSWKAIVRDYSKLYGLMRASKSWWTVKTTRINPQDGGADEAFWNELRAYSRSDSNLVPFQGKNARTFLDLDRDYGLHEKLRGEGLRTVLESIRLLDQKTHDRGSVHLVLIIPTKEYVYYDHCPLEVKNDPRYKRNVKLQREVIDKTIAYLKTHDIPFVDAGKALASAVASETQIYPISTQSHPTGSGYGVIARAVSNWILKERVFPSPHAEMPK
jgi:lysophospholipase L1-like esterase